MMTEMIAEKQFDMGEITLNYAEVGAAGATGAPLVLLHGGTLWWKEWLPIMPALAAKQRVYACDLRGHGKSGRASDHYLLDDFARDIVTFVEQEVGEPAVLIWHSLGALTAMVAAAREPKVARALIMLDPSLLLFWQPLDSLPMLKGWFDFLLSILQTAQSQADVVETLRTAAPFHDEAKLNESAERIYDLDPAMLTYLLQKSVFEGFDLAQGLAQITCPTLIIHADFEHGGAMRDEDAEYARTHLGGATQVVKLEGANHNLLDDNADTVLRIIQQFLATRSL